MPLKPWRKLLEETLFGNPWWTYKRDKVLLPSGKTGEYHYVHSRGSAMIIPYLDDGRILTVNQYRYLLSRESIEFPCGSLKEDTDFEQTAASELREETGFAAGRLELVGEFNPYNGVTNEMCRVFAARDLRHVGAAPEETEEFEYLALKEPEIDEKIRSGEIWDGMTITAWYLVSRR